MGAPMCTTGTTCNKPPAPVAVYRQRSPDVDDFLLGPSSGLFRFVSSLTVVILAPALLRDFAILALLPPLAMHLHLGSMCQSASQPADGPLRKRLTDLAGYE